MNVFRVNWWEVGCTVLVTTVLALLKTTDVTLNNWMLAFYCDIFSFFPPSSPPPLYWFSVRSLHLKHFFSQVLLFFNPLCCSLLLTVAVYGHSYFKAGLCHENSGISLMLSSLDSKLSSVKHLCHSKLLWFLSSAAIGRSAKCQR